MCEVSAKKEASLVQEAVCAQMCSLLERLVKIGSTVLSEVPGHPTTDNALSPAPSSRFAVGFINAHL